MTSMAWNLGISTAAGIFIDLRNLMRNRIRASLALSAVAATVIGGDFNFVVAKGDRRALETMSDTWGQGF